MFSLVTILVFAVVGVVNVVVYSKPATCTKKYEDISVRHTHAMCFIDDADAEQVTLTQEVKDAIVNRHNEIRASVRPTATNMQKMVWDERLAAVAAKWAMQCTVHPARNRAEPDLGSDVFIGQSVIQGFNYKTFVDVVNAWASKGKHWTLGKKIRGALNYVQEIFHSASRVGCGQANCPQQRIPFPIYMYVCHYFTGVYTNEDVYEQGPSCSKCPDTCDASGKLCDCGGKVCDRFNSTLDLNTCQCNPRF